ncbi:MAG: ABC transporter substrate-binding protein [Methylococcales bacterium]
MKQKKSVFAILAILLLAGFVVGFWFVKRPIDLKANEFHAAIRSFYQSWFVKRPNDSNNVPTLSLRLKWLYDPGFAGELVGAHEGLFEKNGLRLSIQPGGFESDPIKLVVNGSDTFGVAGADSFLLARAKGVPIVAFAAGYINTPVVYYSQVAANVKTPADWKGKRIGVQEGQDTATIYRVLLRKAGLTENDVVEIPVKYDLSPFLDGRVDIWPGYAATQSYILHQKGIPYTTVVPREQGVNYVGTVYFTTEGIIREHPEWVQGFLDALIEGWELTYKNEQSAIAAINSFDTKTLTPELIKWNLAKQLSSIKPDERRFCKFKISDFEEMQQILMGQRLIEKSVDLQLSITTKFLDTHYNGKL